MQCPTKLQIFPSHTHTNYSVLDGASSIDEYINWCLENGSPAVGISDHGYLIGALELYLKAKKAGLTPVPGCEFYVAPDEDYIFNKKPYDYWHLTVWAVNEQGYRNLIKLGSRAWNEDTISGWVRIKNKKEDRYERGQVKRVVKKVGVPKPRITFGEILEHNEGLVLGTGCLIGVAAKGLLEGEQNGAENNLLKLMQVYKGRMLAEIFPESCSHNWSTSQKRFIPIDPDGCNGMWLDGCIQKGVNLKLIEIARKYNIPLHMSIDSHFVKPEQKSLQDCLLNNGDPTGWRFHSVYSMLTTEQAWQKWEKTYGSDKESQRNFVEGIEGNRVLALLAKDISITDPYHQPTPEIPQDIQLRSVSDAEKKKQTLLRQINFHGRMHWDDPKWVERLKTELKVICDNGVIDFSDYFLFLEKWCRWANEHSVLAAPGRGSAAGSLLGYLLKITHLDVFEYNLPFERFLSQARVDRKRFPDVDCDFGNRDLVIAKLREHYGDKIAQCSTHITLKIRSAIKDCCRALLGWNANDPRVDEVTKSIGLEPQGVSSKDFLLGYEDQDGTFHSGHLEQNEKLSKFFIEYPEVKDMVLQLLGVPRSVSRHASSYLISDKPIWESVPTCNIGGYTCTQYVASGSNMVEKAGLVKFDFLRVNILDDIAGCIRLVQKKMGYKVWEEEIVLDKEKFKIVKGDLPVDRLPMPNGEILDIYHLPNDQGVFADLSRGETETVFQMNTPLMTGFSKRIKPMSVQDLSDIVALVRPGPLEGFTGEEDSNGNPLTMTEAYIKRRHGLIPITYAHPGMEPILKDSYGVVCYQEDLQRIFSDLAGYTLEEADELREILAKKKKQEMEKRLPILRQRLKEKDWTEKQIEVLVSLCIAASSYGFNKSHSAAYATVAYQSAFLKHHFPLEWWCSVLQNAKVDDIKEKNYVKAVKDILILPHINGPADTFKLQGDKIHAPLYLIDQVGDSACFKIQDERLKNGDFKNLQDFYERVCCKELLPKGESVAVDQTIVKNLILCEAFKYIEPNKSTQELLTEYHYYRRVNELVIGKGKKGSDLTEAVNIYQAKEKEIGTKLDIADLYEDKLEREVARLKALPIYRVDVHQYFRDVMQAYGFSYTDNRASVRIKTQVFSVYQNVKEIEEENPAFRGVSGGWCGLIQDFKTFNYQDRKSKKQVTALKLQISNDGDSVEAVVWPDMYSEMIKQGMESPPMNKICLVTGNVKEAREPGKWSIGVEKIRFF